MATDAPPALLRVTRLIDGISLWSGRIVACLIIPMVAGLTWEVVARYLFNAPTVWAYDMTFMLYGTFFMLGSAYTLMRKGHIRTDTFYGSWPPRVQGAVDAVCYAILFPALVVFLWVGWGYFARSAPRASAW
jgi:TRAP-type mannitol/chloroaromatic compound transport system permease small subunit